MPPFAVTSTIASRSFRITKYRVRSLVTMMSP